LHIGHPSLLDQAHSLKLELAGKLPSLHDPPPAPSKHLTRCLRNRVQAKTLKGWDEYIAKSSKLSVLRTETQKAKNSVRDALKQRLNENNDIDFVAEGDRIRVVRVFRKQQQQRRTRSLDLSSSFQGLEGTSQ